MPFVTLPPEPDQLHLVSRSRRSGLPSGVRGDHDVVVSLRGTASYEDVAGLPDLVRQAVELARELRFPHSCRPEQGRLLQVLAGGRRHGVIGETGTGCGVGLSWMLSGAGPRTQLFSVESDELRASVSSRLFAGHGNVTILHGHWVALLDYAPFDLLVLDGGGAGKGDDEAIDVRDALVMGGTVVIDDFTPMTRWPPSHSGKPDLARLHWIEHPALLTTEIRLAPDLSSIVGTRIR